MSEEGTIDLIHEYVGGSHLLWSKDPIARGLCVANTNLEAALTSASHQLQVLAKVNHNLDLDFVTTVCCGGVEMRKRETAICATCGQPFMAVVSEIRRGRGKTCSHSCAASRQGPKDQTGSQNPNWKGGAAPDHRIYKRQYREVYPERELAHKAVRNAINRGELTRLPCEKCGELASEAHHDDYAKPLAVRWLCRQHHREHHYGNSETPDPQ